MGYRHSRKIPEGGWAPDSPTPFQVSDPPVITVSYERFSVDGVLVSQSHVDHYLQPGSLPERVNLVLVEPFKGVQFEASVGRVNGNNERELYIPKFFLPEEPKYIMNSPESCFIPPDTKNNSIRLYMTLRGKEPPDQGRLFFFIKYRTS